MSKYESWFTARRPDLPDLTKSQREMLAEIREHGRIYDAADAQPDVRRLYLLGLIVPDDSGRSTVWRAKLTP